MARPAAVTMPSRQRSRVANGATLWLDEAAVDSRSKEVRRFRDILGEIISDLGGQATLSEGQRQMARRCAMLAMQCEVMNRRPSQAVRVRCGVYGMLTDRLGRPFQRLGLRRVKRDVTPSSPTSLPGTVPRKLRAVRRPVDRLMGESPQKRLVEACQAFKAFIG